MKRFHGICIITPDVQRLRRFYSDALQVEPQGDDINTVFPTPGAELTLFNAAVMEQMAPGSMRGAGTGSFTLEIEVDDVDAEYARLTANGVPVVKPPQTYPWGRRSAWLRDPDGNIVNFFTAVS
jgi:catechol 2,3-dioxygenase-like lactoylglutathione lyase family enzyme